MRAMLLPSLIYIMMKRSIAFSLLLALSLSACTAQPEMVEPTPTDDISEQTLDESVTPPPSDLDLLTLDAQAPECTEAPRMEMNAMTGAEEAIYPVYAAYATSSYSDKYQLKAVFTAAACGEGRVEELFGDRTWSDYRIVLNEEAWKDENLMKALDDQGFKCDEKGDSAAFCSYFYHEGDLSVEDLLPLRSWEDKILGTDCTLCG